MRAESRARALQVESELAEAGEQKARTAAEGLSGGLEVALQEIRASRFGGWGVQQEC